MARVSVVSLAVVLCMAAHVGIALQRAVHPDEPADYTMNERLSVRYSMDSLAAIKSALDSFRKLTAAAVKTMPKEKLNEIGNTGWEMQNLGFANHVESVKGTLLKQEYLLNKLACELAERKSKSGEVDQKELLKIKREYEESEKRFKKFWEGFRIAD